MFGRVGAAVAVAGLVAVAGAANPAAAAADPVVTFTVVAADGSPLKSGEITIIDVDNLFADTPATATVKQGVAKVRLAKANYSAVGVERTGKGATQVTRVVPITDFAVKKAPVKLTIDYRTADQRPTVNVPRPAGRRSLELSWTRFDLETGLAGGTSVKLGPEGDLLVAPEKAAKVGRLSVTYAWQLAATGYTYDLAVNTDAFRSRPTFTFGAADLATVTSSYYGDGGPQRTGAFLRSAAFAEDEGFGPGATYQPVLTGTRRTEYVGSRGSIPIWRESAIADYSGKVKDRDRVDALNPRPIFAGSTAKRSWFRGPITPAVPTFASDQAGLCLACQGKTAMEIEISPLVDSVPDHVGVMRPFGKTDPMVRFRAYRDGHPVKDTTRLPTGAWQSGLYDGTEIPVLGGRIATPKQPSRYRLVLDVSRRAQAARTSTISQTTLTFSSRPGQGKLPPSDWSCITSPFNCRVLPILTARLSLPLALDGTLPAARSTLTLKAGRIQDAKRSKVTAATLELRRAGEKTWHQQPLKRTADGTYTAVVDNTAWAGSAVDARLTAKDARGSAFAQTVQSAYVVQGA